MGGIWSHLLHDVFFRLELALWVLGFHASSRTISDTDRDFSAWIFGPELVPVRYRHVGSALNGKTHRVHLMIQDADY